MLRMIKNNIWLLIIIMFIIISGGVFMIKGKKEIVISNIKSFHFNYSVGYMANAYVVYEIEYKDDKYFALVKPNGISEEDRKEIQVDKAFVSSVEEVLRKYQVEKWNGFNKSDQNVLDGDSFSLSIGNENGNYISASGYMKWPNNYSDVRKELDLIFMEIYNKEI